MFRGLEESQPHSAPLSEDVVFGLDGLYITENTIDGTTHHSGKVNGVGTFTVNVGGGKGLRPDSWVSGAVFIYYAINQNMCVMLTEITITNKKDMEQLHLEVKMIEDPSNPEEYTNPSSPYVILTQDFDCDVPDIRVCRSVEEVMDNYNGMKKYEDPITIEEITNYEDYDEEVVNYVVSCLKNLDDCPAPFWGISQAMECEVEWENLSDNNLSLKFTLDADDNVEIQ